MTLYATQLRGRTVAASEGKVGALEDLLVDDRQWVVRFLAIRTCASTRLTLVPPTIVWLDPRLSGRFRLELRRRRLEEWLEERGTATMQSAADVLSAREADGYIVEAEDGALGVGPATRMHFDK